MDKEPNPVSLQDNSALSNSREPFAPLQYYTQWQRIIAYIIDVIILGLPTFVLGFTVGLIAGLTGREVPSYLLIIFNILLLFAFLAYFIYCEYKWGWTLGKKILGIKVFMEDGSPCTLKAAIIRNLAKIFWYIIPLLTLLDLILIYKTRKKQRIGDFLAHTVVINVGQKHLRQPPYSEFTEEGN